MIDIKETEYGIVLQVHVVPRSAKSEVVGIQGDALKIKLTSPPVEGQANAECIRFLSDILGIKKKQVKILSGHKAKKKSVAIEGIGKKDIEALISRTAAR